MNCPACCRALAFASLVAISLPGTRAEAGQSEPVSQPKTETTPATPAHSSGLTGKVGTPQLQLTPAQQRYGLPKNPKVGPPVDTDLSKPLTLERAIRIGLQQQNAIAIAQTQTEAAKAQLTQARSSYYPQITPSLSYIASLRPGGTVFVNGVPFGGSRQSETRTDAIVARQLIWDTGRREASVGLSRRNVFAAEYSLGDQRQDVILSVITAYYNVLRDQELVRVQEENARRAQTTLDSIRAQVEVGNAAQSDTLQAESDLANAQVALLQAQNNLNVDQATLKNAMGVVTSQPLLLADQQAAPPNTMPDTSGIEHYVQIAYDDRLDIKAQQERVNAQGYNVRLAHIDNGISAQADITEGYQLDPDAGEERQFTVSISYPLFDGGNTRAAVRQRKAQLEQERRTLDQLQQAVRLNVEQSYLTREQARRSITASQAAVRAGQTNYDAALEKQRNGLINIIDVITAEAQLVQAQVNLVQSIYDFYIADARLQRDIGRNDPEYVPNVPGAKKPEAAKAVK